MPAFRVFIEGSTILSSPSWRPINPIGTFVAVILVPLALVALGLWQYQRATADLTANAAVVVEIGATGHSPSTIAAQDALPRLESERKKAGLRRNLAWVVMIAGAITGVLGPIFMGAACVLGQVGRRSRATLIVSYRRVRRLLPALMILLLLAPPASLAAAAYGEVLVGEQLRIWLAVPFILVVAPASLLGGVMAFLWGDIIGLCFSADPVLVPGRPVSHVEAPGLWQLVATLAARLGTQPPESVMVGLTGDISLLAGPVQAEGTTAALPGNALYVPLPLLAFHREDEIAANIAYEIAHFAGADPGYPDGFALMEADIDRSMGDLLKRHARYGTDTLSLLLWPGPPVGIYAMGQFLHAMRYWHRQRVFAADAAAATLVSPAAMARALLRREAVRRPIRDALKLAWNQHDQARDGSFIALALAHAAEQGLDAPIRRQRGTDPAIRDRIGALGQDLSAMIAEAKAAPGPEAAGRLGLYLADPEATVREATRRFVARGAPGRPIRRRTADQAPLAE